MARSSAKKKPAPGGRAEAVNVMDALAKRLAQLGKRKWKVTGVPPAAAKPHGSAIAPARLLWHCAEADVLAAW